MKRMNVQPMGMVIEYAPVESGSVQRGNRLLLLAYLTAATAVFLVAPWLKDAWTQAPTVLAANQPASPPAAISHKTPDYRVPRTSSSARVTSLTYCASIQAGLTEYEEWLKTPDLRDLQSLIMQYGGELVAPGQQLRVETGGPVVTQLRTTGSNTLCYLPTRLLEQ